MSNPQLPEPPVEARRQQRPHPARVYRSEQPPHEPCRQERTATANPDSETKGPPPPPPPQRLPAPPPPSFMVKFRTSPFSKYKQCVIRPLPAKPRPKKTEISKAPPPATHDTRRHPPPFSTPLEVGSPLGKGKKRVVDPQDHAEEQQLHTPGGQTERCLSSYLPPETDWTVSKQSRTDLGMSVPTGGGGMSSLQVTRPWEGAEMGGAAAGGRMRRRRNSHAGRSGSFRRRRKSLALPGQQL